MKNKIIEKNLNYVVKYVIRDIDIGERNERNVFLHIILQGVSEALL